MKITKKLISWTASSFVVLIISGFLSLQPIDAGPAFAQDGGAQQCKDLTMTDGTTEAILSEAKPGRVAGVADSGALDFNLPADGAYQACAEQNAQSWRLADQPANITGNFIRGWAWNTNLGDVSFYCKDGVNGAGASCGNVNYGVVAIPSADKVRGFAWSDVAGWISMGCDTSPGVDEGFNLGVAGCGVNGYGVQIAKQADVGQNLSGCPILAAGDLYGYAWNKSVGWMNFCGVHADFASPFTVNVNIATVAVQAGAEVEVGVDGANVYANGTDGYDVVVQFMQNGEAVTDLGGHTADVSNLVWDDKVRADQVTKCAPADAGAANACTYNGALKPVPASFVWSAEKKGLVARVKSIAPTNDVDKVSLKEITVNIDGVGQIIAVNKAFAFKPALEISRVSSASLSNGAMEEDRISVVKDTSEAVYITGAKHNGAALPANNSIQIYNQLHACETNRSLGFIFDEGDAGTSTDINDYGDANDRANIDRVNNPCQLLGGQTLSDISQVTFAQFLANAADVSGTISRLIFPYIIAGKENMVPMGSTLQNVVGMRVRVEYNSALGGHKVRYFAKTVNDGSMLNQSANIKGNVRIDIQKMIGGVAPSKSLGEAAQSRREQFARVLNTMVRTMTPTSPNAQGAYYVTDGTSNGAKPVLNYIKNNSLVKPCKVVLEQANPENISFASSLTLVTMGCDVYINNNVYSSAVGRKGRLGIVAMADMNMSGDRKGGNVYICNKVTDLEANIVADGSVFGYGQDETTCGNPDNDAIIGQADGLPKFQGPPRTVARRQLTITGALVSNNTNGGAFSTPMVLGDGTLTTNQADVYKARLYDLNFLRYPNTKPDPRPELSILGYSCWADDVVLSRTTIPAGKIMCDVNSPEVTGIVNITYRAPSSDMPVFNAVK